MEALCTLPISSVMLKCLMFDKWTFLDPLDLIWTSADLLKLYRYIADYDDCDRILAGVNTFTRNVAETAGGVGFLSTSEATMLPACALQFCQQPNNPCVFEDNVAPYAPNISHF